MNQVLNGEAVINIDPTQLTSPTDGGIGFDFLFILRIIFYAIVFIKVLSIAFNRKKRPNLKDRVYRKFVFSHNQVLRNFTEQDKQIMELTLNNTIKNALVDVPKESKPRGGRNKKVNFQIERNNYYLPKDFLQKMQMQHQNEKEVDKYFQVMEKNPPKDECVMKHIDENPHHQNDDHEHIQKQDQNTNLDLQLANDEEHSSLLPSKLTQSTVQSRIREKTEEENENFDSLL